MPRRYGTGRLRRTAYTIVYAPTQRNLRGTAWTRPSCRSAAA